MISYIIVQATSSMPLLGWTNTTCHRHNLVQQSGQSVMSLAQHQCTVITEWFITVCAYPGWLEGRDRLPILLPDFLPGDIPEGGSRHGRRTAWLLP